MHTIPAMEFLILYLLANKNTLQPSDRCCSHYEEPTELSTNQISNPTVLLYSPIYTNLQQKCTHVLSEFGTNLHPIVHLCRVMMTK